MTSNERTLRMYLHPSRKLTRISLEGDLSAGWVQEVERCWRALSGPGDSLSVDVSGLESADPNGYRLLDTMRSQGVIVTGLDPGSGLLLRRIDSASGIRQWLMRLCGTLPHADIVSMYSRFLERADRRRCDPEM